MNMTPNDEVQMYAYLLVQMCGLLEPENIKEFAISSTLQFFFQELFNTNFCAAICFNDLSS
jgi:hypothetical protein